MIRSSRDIDRPIPLPGGERPRILVTCASGLGDLLLATPLFTALRERYPEGRIDCFTMFASAGRVARATGRFDHVHCHDLTRMSPARGAREVLSVRRNGYDCNIVTFPSNRAHYNVLAALLGAPVRIGHEYRAGSSLRYARWLLTHRVPQGGHSHAVEQNLELARAAGCRVRRPAPMDVGSLGTGESRWARAVVGGDRGRDGEA